MRTTIIIIIIILLSLSLFGCDKTRDIYFFDNICKTTGTYCHLYRQEGGSAYLNFTNSTGNFIYEVN